MAEYVLRSSRRGTTGTWVLVLVAIVAFSVSALIAAFARPTVGDAGGAGNVVVPALIAAFASIALMVMAGQWWDGATYFRAEGDAIAARHGFRVIRGRAARLSLESPVVLQGEGATGHERLLLQQGDTRVVLGSVHDLRPDALAAWEQWMRHAGAAVERRWTPRRY